jgi:flavorubredoxin
MFPLVSEAIARVMAINKLRYIGVSHVGADECGALNELLALAPQAVPLCGRIAAMDSLNDLADRAPRVLADAELPTLGDHTLHWFDTPHTPHAWDCGSGQPRQDGYVVTICICRWHPHLLNSCFKMQKTST